MTKSENLTIYRNLNYSEKQYGYLLWRLENDSQIKELLNNLEYINIILNGKVSSKRNIEFNRRRIYIGSEIKKIRCDKVRIEISRKSIDIKCI